MNNKVLSLAIISLWIVTQVSCTKRNEEKFIAYRPQEQEEFNAKIKEEIYRTKRVIVSFPEYSCLIGYKAVRNNDISLCENTEYPNLCRELSKRPLALNAVMIEGDCNTTKYDIPATLRALCTHVMHKTCFSLAGWEKDYCEGFSKENYNIYKKALTSHSSELIDEEKAPIIFAIFLGFKRGIDGCKKMQSLLKGKDSFLCDIVFGKEDVDTILDDVLNQMALFYVAKNNNLPSLCNEIKNKELRSSCFDPRAKRIE